VFINLNIYAKDNSLLTGKMVRIDNFPFLIDRPKSYGKAYRAMKASEFNLMGNYKTLI